MGSAPCGEDRNAPLHGAEAAGRGASEPDAPGRNDTAATIRLQLTVRELLL